MCLSRDGLGMVHVWMEACLPPLFFLCWVGCFFLGWAGGAAPVVWPVHLGSFHLGEGVRSTSHQGATGSLSNLPAGLQGDGAEEGAL